MPLGISKDCFPDPSVCHNCLKKETTEIKKQSETKKDFKRCSNCHIMTYCDKDCQKQHWLQVHKKHCKFLAGKALVKDSHNAANCVRCIEERESSPTQLRSDNSPKSACNIEEVSMAMKETLGMSFRFHGEGKKCNCSMEYAFDLPFPLGEESGQYLQIGGSGLDYMLAHVLKILTAMAIKTRNKEALKPIWDNTIIQRSYLWCDILVGKRPSFQFKDRLLDLIKGLQSIHGSSNPWWKSLIFSVNFLCNTSQNLVSDLVDSQSLGDLRFQRVKLVHDYQQSQLQIQVMVTERQMWHNFMLWPELVNGSLAILLPPETRCQSCFNELSGKVVMGPGEVTIRPDGVNSRYRPILLFDVGDNGALMACCPIAKNKNCINICIKKDLKTRMHMDKKQWEEFLKEVTLFGIESRSCDFCLKSSLSAHRCSACLTVQYCSTACQKEDLNFHMTVCSTWAKDESRRLLGKEKQKDHWKTVFGKK